MTKLQRMLIDFRDKRISFGEFVAGTRKEYTALACYLMKRWTPPEWFTVEDIEQELYLGTWKYVPKFDPTRGVTFSRYIVYNSLNCAKIRLHKARGVTLSGIPDKKISNIETPLSMFPEEFDGDALMNSLVSEAPKAEENLINEQERKKAVALALKSCEEPKERYVVLAIREAGSLDAAGRLLYDDIDHRITLRLSSEWHAHRFVMRHANAVARRLVENSVVSN